MAKSTFWVLFVVLVAAGGGLYWYYTQNPQELLNQELPTMILGEDETNLNNPSHPTNPDGVEPPAVATARAYAAAKAGTDVLATSVMSVTSHDWPDGCLGLGGVDELCTQAIVPGYRIVVSINGQQQAYRTNVDGTVIVQEP